MLCLFHYTRSAVTVKYIRVRGAVPTYVCFEHNGEQLMRLYIPLVLDNHDFPDLAAPTWPSLVLVITIWSFYAASLFQRATS